MALEHDLLAQTRDSRPKFFDGGAVAEPAVDGVFDKYAQPVDFLAKHVGLCVAVDQPILALADQRTSDPVAGGNVVEILPWNAGCLGASAGSDRGDGTGDIEKKRRFSQNFILADTIEQ